MAMALDLASGLTGIAVLFCFYRLLRGPSLPDRILALETLYGNTIIILILTGLRFDTGLYFEAALIIAMLGFVSTLVLAKFLIRPDIIE